MFKKIAVLRANALGDFIFILPALSSIRKAFPTAEIVLLGRELHRELLKGRPSPVDRVEVIPRYAGVGEAADYCTDVREAEEFFDRMKHEKFDVAIQMHGGGRYSNPFVLRLGAKLTLGSKTIGAAPLDINIPYTAYFSEIVRYLELVSCIGVTPSSLEPELTATPDDRANAAKVISSLDDKPLALLQPGASDPRRWWPGENFARVADTLIERGFQVCFNGVASESDLVQSIISRMTHRSAIIPMHAPVSLSALVGILSEASLVISNDTGPLHLAAALKTPSVGLYWAPNMITGMPMSARTMRPLISWNTNCPLCGASFSEQKQRTDCSHMVSFTAGIAVEDVLCAIDELMESRLVFREVVSADE